MKWGNKGHEFDTMFSNFQNKSRKYYIWGAGTFGRAFYEEFCNKICILGFVDSNSEKQEKELCGLKIISPEKFHEKYTDELVVVSTGQTRSVYKQLEAFGLRKHQDYYHIDEFSSVYMMYQHDTVYVSDITVDITECCTLKCEYCNAFIPHIKGPRHYDVNFIKDELEQYFRWVDEVNVLSLCGGDAMAHPKFDEILEWIGERYYPVRAKHIEIYSNAVLIPSETTIELFKKYNVIYRFTDYYGNSGRQNIEKVTALLQNNGILYDHVKFTEWYDSGYPQKSNGIETQEGLISFFNQCDRKTCHGIMGDKLFFCDMCVCAERIGYCEIEESDYFDLSNYERQRRKEFLEYYLGYNEKGYFNYCKLCNGSLNVNTHKIPVGKQIQ